MASWMESLKAFAVIGGSDVSLPYVWQVAFEFEPQYMTSGASIHGFLREKKREECVTAYEHVVNLTGYNAESIRYENKGTPYDVSNRLFMESWGEPGNMMIIAKDDYLDWQA